LLVAAAMWFEVSLAVLLVVAAVGFFLVYSGAFTQPAFRTETSTVGPFTFLYKPHAGPYKNTGRLFGTMSKLSQRVGVPVTAMLGIYYDDPHHVSRERLRSHVGFTIEDKDFNDNVRRYCEVNQIEVKPLKRTIVKTAVFPWRNFISIIFAVIRVYGEAHRRGWVQCAPMELYGVEPDSILFAFPVDNQEQYKLEPGKLT